MNKKRIYNKKEIDKILAEFVPMLGISGFLGYWLNSSYFSFTDTAKGYIIFCLDRRNTLRG